MATSKTKLRQIRIEKLEKMREMGIEPFGRNVEFSDNSISLNKKYGNFSKEDLLEKKQVASVVLRIMTRRGPFIIGQDSNGPMQIYVPKKISTKVAKLISLLDLGDIIKATGFVMKTQVGSLTIRASNVEIVTKAIRPLPEKFHGLKDVEERYRKRYLDLIMNKNVREIFRKRTKIISLIRSFMDQKGFMEVDTPVLSPILGGALALPFTTFHNALKMNFYLRIATELPLKKLLVGGFDKVYEIGRLFRNEGIDTTHNPEFTTIEFYEAFSNLDKIMIQTENVLIYIAKKLQKQKIIVEGREIIFKAPFKRLSMVDAVSQIVQKDMKNISFLEAKKIAQKEKIKVLKYFQTGHIINALFEKYIEDTLIQPTFVTDFPIEISPLAAKTKDNPKFTERAELFINKKEYANMFTELNDPVDQLERFQAQLAESKSGNEEASQIDMSFVEALEYGMPPAGGCGIGLDRLIMLFTGQTSIREILLFPHLKDKPIS